MLVWSLPRLLPVYTSIITSIAYISQSKSNYNAESSAYLRKCLKNPQHFYPLGIARNLTEIIRMLKIFKHCMLWYYLSFPIIPSPSLAILSCFLHTTEYFTAVELAIICFSSTSQEPDLQFIDPNSLRWCWKVLSDLPAFGKDLDTFHILETPPYSRCWWPVSYPFTEIALIFVDRMLQSSKNAW